MEMSFYVKKRMLGGWSLLKKNFEGNAFSKTGSSGKNQAIKTIPQKPQVPKILRIPIRLNQKLY